MVVTRATRYIITVTDVSGCMGNVRAHLRVRVHIHEKPMRTWLDAQLSWTMVDD